VAHGVRLTDTRRLVLGLILTSDRPSGAYDLLDRLQEWHRNAAPPTIYRALEFLSENGLIHRIERLSAFVACTHRLECGHGDACAHRAQFLICRSCNIITELDDPRIDVALATATGAVGFRLEQATIEIEGLCATCSAAQEDGVAP